MKSLAPKFSLALLGVTAIVASSFVLLPSAIAADPATGTTTSVAKVAGKGVGTDQWGFIGDVETLRTANASTFTYGVAVSPTDGSLWVTDSGKVAYNSFLCQLSGFPASPCQLGSPRVLHYPASGTVGTDYKGNGTFAATAASGSTGVNAGVGSRFPLSSKQTLDYGAVANHGPRGVVVDSTGAAWIADSEAASPLPQGVDLTQPLPPAAIGEGAVKRFDSTLKPLAGAGYTGTWPQSATTGVLNYRAGVDLDSTGKLWVNNEVRDALDSFGPDGTASSRTLLDVPRDSYVAGDPGYRNPYGIAIDRTDNSYYVPLINFRDDAALRNTPFLEKRDATGKVLIRFGEAQLTKGQVVFGAYVNQVTRNVFVWSGADGSSSSLFEYTKDGALVRSYTSTQFPGLTNIRGVASDSRGYLYVTVGQGGSTTRVMILGKTPDAVSSVCPLRSGDKTSVNVSWECTGPVAEGDKYSQAPVLDYVVEQREVGGTAWTVVPGPASTQKSRTITGLDPTKDYEFRVSAWNEAGNGDWTSATSVVAEASADVMKADYNSAGSVDVFSNDSFGTSPNADSISLLDAAGAPTKSVTVAGQGSYTLDGSTVTFTPVVGFVGEASSVKYRVSLSPGCVVEATVTATIGSAAVLTLVKKVDGDTGSAEASSWILSAKSQDENTVSGHSGSAQVTGVSVKPGSYELSETGPTENYSSNGFICVIDNGDPLPASSTVVLAAGQVTTCTVTNTFKAPPTETPTPTPTPTSTPTTTPTSTPTEPATSNPSMSASPTSSASTDPAPGVSETTKSQTPSKPTQQLPDTGFTESLWVFPIAALMLGGVVLLIASRRGRHSS